MTLDDVLNILHAIEGRRERDELLPRLARALHAVVRADWVAVIMRQGRNAPTASAYVDPPIPQGTYRIDDFVPSDTQGTKLGAFRFGEADLVGFPKHQEFWRSVGVRVAVRIPLVVENALVGALAFWSRDPRGFEEIDLSVATELGTIVAVALDSCLAYEHLAQLREAADDANTYLHDALATAGHCEMGLVGNGPAIGAIKRQIELVGPTDATVLLTGESGTGKDVVARAIRAASARNAEPFVTVNCAAIPSTLAESELFGHEEGAFTGSAKSRAGRFEQADGGTLFLDEIGELSLDIQAKLLRVLQERELERVGGADKISIDVRIIAATNRDLQELIRMDRFREDLYFRLAVFPIHLPPLRARLEDLPELVEHFVRVAADRFAIAPRRVTPEVIRRLSDHDWPGNVRELQHAIERAMLISSGDVLNVDAVVPRRLAPISTGPTSDTLRASYVAALEAAGWVIEGPEGAALQLGIHPNTLRHRMKRMAISRPLPR